MMLEMIPLGERGQIYVSLAAGERYAKQRKMQLEEARRELTELLIEARLTESSDDKWSYRARSRTSGLDIMAQVVEDSRLLVVVSVNVRWR